MGELLSVYATHVRDSSDRFKQKFLNLGKKVRVRKPAVKSAGLSTVHKAQMPVFARLDPVILAKENAL